MTTQLAETNKVNNTTAQLTGGTFNYGQWRLDKPKEAGYSHELISAHFDSVKGTTTVDELLVLPAPGINTLYKAFEMNKKKWPNA